MLTLLTTTYIQGGLSEVRDAYGRTPLMHAVHNGLVDLARGLLQKGADPNAVDPQHGFSALHEAAYCCSPAVCVSFYN